MTKKRPHNRMTARSRSPVAFRHEIVEEDLPRPWVHYPGHYGYFMAFAATADDEPALCSCAEDAVRNYLALKLDRQSLRHHDPLKAAPLGSHGFPPAISSLSLGSDDPLRAVHFLPGLCHRCNPAVPSLLWCHPMYGSEFKQHYGWYAKQAMLRNGVGPPRSWPSGWSCLPDTCPPDLLGSITEQQAAIRIAYAEHCRRADEIRRRDVITTMMKSDDDLRDKVAKLKKLVDDEFENVAREEFGFARIGEGWVNETLMFRLVQGLFPGKSVFHHYWPAWLTGLELDVFVPEAGLAFEYQGIQHYEPVEMWGGQKALETQRKRDAIKASKCRDEGVALVEVRYDDPLTSEFLQSLINEASEACS